MIDKVDIKLNILKRKINSKILGIVIYMIFGILVIFSLEMTNNFKRQKNLVQDEYNKSMYLAISYINNVEADLAKLLVTSTTKMRAVTLANIWKNSNLAKENLDQIPVTQSALDNTCKYLTQLSDFSYSLMKQNVSNEKLTDRQYEMLREIHLKSQELGEKMKNIYDDLNLGKVKWDELEKNANKELSNIELGTTLSSISDIAKTFQNYEGLIYDGAFSDHILNIKPLNLSEKECSGKEAEEYIRMIFKNDSIKEIIKKEDSSGRIELYNFDITFYDKKEKLSLSITKKGCKLYLMIGDKTVKDEKITIDEAKQKGYEFLKKIGIGDIKDTYYQKLENIAVINYAGVQDGVVLYPDLIKVKVALDDGTILGVEAQGYIFNHTKRKNITPNISIDSAKEVINSKVDILSSDLAIIPTEYNTEILTYEFKGRIDDRDFLIYINAQNANEEKVLLILDSDKGVLTM